MMEGMTFAEITLLGRNMLYSTIDLIAAVLFLYGFVWLTDAVKTMKAANAHFAKFVLAEAVLGVSWQLMAAIIWWATP